MKQKIKKILVAVSCMAIASASLVGCAGKGEPEWWTKFKGWFDKEQSAPVEDESGEKDETSDEETEGEGEKEESGTTSEE